MKIILSHIKEKFNRIEASAVQKIENGTARAPLNYCDFSLF